MFQKKVPGYRKGGGIMHLATGGVIPEFPPKIVENMRNNQRFNILRDGNKQSGGNKTGPG